MGNEVSHRGRVLSVGDGTAVVEIISKSACAACHAAGACTMADIARKEITVPVAPQAAYSPGDEVDVVMRKSMGAKAVWVAYVIPVSILIVFVLSLSLVGVSELMTGLGGLAAVALYFFAVWLLRGRLADESAFYIRS